MNTEGCSETYGPSQAEIELKNLKYLVAKLFDSPTNEELYQQIMAVINDPTPQAKKKYFSRA